MAIVVAVLFKTSEMIETSCLNQISFLIAISNYSYHSIDNIQGRGKEVEQTLFCWC